MEKNKWYIANVVILFSKLKGCVKTETNRRMVYPGEWFMPLVDNPKGTWIGLNPTKGLVHQATKKELQEHFKNS